MFAATNVRRFAHPLSILFTVLISHTILTVGLPIPRQEHASGSDLIAGEAFLSILMGGLTPNERANIADLHRQLAADDDKSFGLKTQPQRTSRTFQHVDLEEGENAAVETTSDSDLDVTPSIQIRNDIDNREAEEGTIIAVSVSSSVGHSMINKHVYTHEEKNEDVRIEDPESTEVPTTTLLNSLDDELVEEKPENNETEADQEAIPSEDAPSLIAEANKSEFHVDEMEPISRDYIDPHSNPNVPHAGVNPPSPIPFDGKSYPGTVIYHNEGGNNRARSVSYSTVIQALPSVQKDWAAADGHPNMTGTSAPLLSNAQAQMQHQIPAHVLPSNIGAEAESKDYFVTSKYEDPSRYYSPEPTERNWGIPEQNYHEPSKPYTPIVYAQPEQNYEVDEAVSVETNGRAHGIQPVAPIPQPPQPPQPPLNQGAHHQSPAHGKILPPGKKDDNQKVGYVVEGRNYRKYRVEERTSDGFIVGEYGVVRHDDGSLRGVRYTADGTISPRLIYDALMKFLSL